MNIEFDAETTKIVAAGRAAWAKLKRDETWADWVAVGRAISAGKAVMMRYLRTNNPAGRQWAEHFGGWLQDNGFDEIDKGVRSRLEKCMDYLPEIEAWREMIGVDKRLAWNHPNTVWRHFSTKHGIAEKEAKKVPAKGGDEVVKELQDIADNMRESLGNGRLFDLSTPELIAESARNFAEIYGKDPSRAFAQALQALLMPPATPELDPAFTASLRACRRGRTKALDDPSRPRNRGKAGAAA